MNYRRIVRRATHASRSMPAVIAAMLVGVLSGWAATEITLHYLDRTALLVSAESAWRIVLDPGLLPRNYAVIGGGATAVVGLLAMVLAMKPGRLRKHQRNHACGAVIVDDSLIAGFLVRELALATQLPDSHVDVTLSRRYARAYLVPISGLRIVATQVENQLQSILDSDGFQPRLQAQVKVAKIGKVG